MKWGQSVSLSSADLCCVSVCREPSCYPAVRADAGSPPHTGRWFCGPQRRFLHRQQWACLWWTLSDTELSAWLLQPGQVSPHRVGILIYVDGTSSSQQPLQLLAPPLLCSGLLSYRHVILRHMQIRWMWCVFVYIRGHRILKITALLENKSDNTMTISKILHKNLYYNKDEEERISNKYIKFITDRLF